MSEDISITNLSEEHKNNLPEDLRTGKPFDWYLNTVVEDPKIARNAHQRLADMFDYYGKEYNENEDIVEYKMARDDPLNDGEHQFYGKEVHRTIHQFVNKIKSGARGMGPERRIKLLLGPVGSGKSEFDKLVRQYFENYTMTDDGRMYTFQWTNLCDIIDDQDPSDDVVRSPMNQDPLVLLPEKQREKVVDRMNENLDEPYTIEIDQSLDPESAFYLDKLMEYYDEDLASVLEHHIEVVRLVADENQRRCIETFEPKDEKNQDETELTGDVNYSKLAIYGESDPRAFDYGGAFCNANRGIFSGEELLKLQREFLYDFLHATQEQTIKPKNNPRIDIDQVIVGRTNLPEYQEKRNDEKMEAFLDRSKRIDHPYVLQYQEEAKILKKLVQKNADIGEIHVEPHVTDMVALFAVLTRIYEPEGDNITILQKAKAYDGSGDEDIDPEELREKAEQHNDVSEGMFGISSRITGDILAESIINESLDETTEKKYLFPLSVFSYIEENLEKIGSIDQENIEEYIQYLEIVKDEYRERAVEDVRQALAYDKDEIRKQGEKYLDHVMGYIEGETVEDEVTGEEREPDEKFLRSVEEKLDIPENRKDDFRQEVSNWVSRRAREGKPFKPENNERLQRALEKKLWEEKKHNINFSALVSSGDIENSGDANKWIENLEREGYSKEGAKELLNYAGAMVAKEEM